MKVWIIRGLMLAGLLVVEYVLYNFLEPIGYVWVVWAIAGVPLVFFAVEMGLQRRKRAREKENWLRWKAAVLDPPARKKALEELRRELARAYRFGPRLRVTQARLSVITAEIQLAGGKSTDAIKTLAKLELKYLEPLQAAAIRLARAQAYLHLGDVDGAAATLGPIAGEKMGDAVLDAALTLAFGAIALEEGRVDEAARAAAEIVEVAEEHDELWDEAKALEAACLEDRDEPHLESLRAIREEPGRLRLRALGPRRLREMLEELDGT